MEPSNYPQTQQSHSFILLRSNLWSEAASGLLRMGAGALKWLYKGKTQNAALPFFQISLFSKNISFRPSVEAPLSVTKKGRKAAQ